MSASRSFLLFFVALALGALSCNAVNEMLAPSETLPPPPTAGGPSLLVTATPAEGVTEPGAEATGTRSPTPTPATPTLEELGPPPADVEELLLWVEQAQAGAIPLADICTALAAAGWQVGDDTCEAADLDGDGEASWLLTLDFTRLMEDGAPAPVEGHVGDFWLVRNGAVAFRSQIGDKLDLLSSAPRLLDLVDMTGDDLPEVITVSVMCGAHTCVSNYVILGNQEGEIENLVRLNPPEGEELPPGIVPGISLSTVTAEQLVDETGDDLPDLVISGGIVGSVGAGLQRSRTEVWSWDGESIALAEQIWEETGYRFHTLYNANYAFSQGDYERAQALYDAVIVDETLQDTAWADASETAVRDAVRQFAGFRLALIPLTRGDITEATRWRNWLQEAYSNSPIGAAADLLITEWDRNGNRLPSACDVVTTYLEQQPDPTGPLVDMGYNNPSLTALSLCPLDESG